MDFVVIRQLVESDPKRALDMAQSLTDSLATVVRILEKNPDAVSLVLKLAMKVSA